jgi:integrase
MARTKRPNGAGELYIKHNSYYGRWTTVGGGKTNRKLGPVRRPGTAAGLTRAQAEKRLREMMGAVQVTTDRDRTIRAAGEALLAHLEARGCAKSHLESVESHLRVHLLPFFGDRPLDRIAEDDVTRLLVRLRRSGRAPKTTRNILSTLHSVFALARKRRWVDANPCQLVDLPAPTPSGDVRFLSEPELAAVLDFGVPDDERGWLERTLDLMAAMTGLRQGELLALRWRDLDVPALKVRVRRAYVRGEFKSPKSRRGVRGVPMAAELERSLRELRERSSFTADDDDGAGLADEPCTASFARP